MKSKTRQITEGAMMIACIAVILLINRQSANFFEDMIFWLLSLPMIVYVVRYGAKAGSIVFVSCMFTSVLFSTFTGIFYLFSALGIGLIYGYGLSKDYKNGILLAFSIIGHLIVTFLTAWVMAGIFGYNIAEEFADLTKALGDVGAVVDTKTLVMSVIALSYIGLALLQGIVVHAASHVLLERLRIKVKPLKPIQEIELPRWLGYPVVIGWGLYLLSGLGMFSKELEPYIFVIYFIALIIGIANGLLALLSYLIKKRKRNMVMFAILACFIPGINNIVLMIGIVDFFWGFPPETGSR